MTKHYILPGSMEMDGSRVTAGVHTGSSEFDVKDLRYVAVDVVPGMSGTVLDLMASTYEGSEGCLLKGDFRKKEA